MYIAIVRYVSGNQYEFTASAALYMSFSLTPCDAMSSKSPSIAMP